MYIHKNLTSVNTNQVAYPVGLDQAAYYLTAVYNTNVETGVITGTYEVLKNHKELLFTGTAKECQDFIIDIVRKEGEWIRDEKYNYVHQIPAILQA